jgi:single-stranded-DNA-specific exonuclease
VMVSIGEEISHGSCRSVPGFNIEAVLAKCAYLLEDYGGHKQAAGFSLKNERLEEFEHTLLEVAQRELEGIELKPEIRIDSELDLAHDGEAAFRAVFKLAPFGAGNPPPVFISRNLKVVACDGVGKKQEHLRLRLAAGDRVWEAMAFRAGERRGEVGSRIDIVYNLEIDWWKGVEKLRLLAQDFAPSV